MSVLGALTIKIAGDLSAFNKDIANVQKQLNAQTKGLQTVAKNMSSVGDNLTKSITLPLIAAGAGLFKIGNDFDEAYDKIRVDTGKTGKEFEALKNNFKEVAKDSASSFDEISSAVSGYNKMLGLADKPLEDLSKQILNVSRITKTDLNANVTTSAKLFNNWKVSTENQSKTLDLMFRASQQTGIGITDLMADVTSSGQILRAMGYDIEEATALVAGFDKAGIETSSTIAAMKIGLKNMAKEGFTDPQEVLAMYIDKIKTAKTDIEATGIAAELFGARGGPQMAQAIRDGKLDLDGLIESLKTGTDTINGVTGATDDWKEKLIKLKNEALINLEPLANKIFDSATRAVENVTPKIEELTEWFGNLDSGMQDSLLSWGLLLVTIGPALSLMGRMTTTVIQLRNAMILLNGTITAGSGLSLLIKLAPEAALAAGLMALQVNDMNKSWAGFEGAMAKLKQYQGGAIGAWFSNSFYAASEGARILATAIKEKLVDAYLTGKIGAETFKSALVELSGVEGLLRKEVYDGIQGTKEELAVIDEITAGTYKLTGATQDNTNATVEQKAAMIDYENTLQGIMSQYNFTREQAEEYYELTQEGTDIINEQVDTLRDLYSALFDNYLLNADITAGLSEAQKAYGEYTQTVKDHGANSVEAKQKEEDWVRILDDLTATKIPELIDKTGALTEKEQGHLIKMQEQIDKAKELGIITPEEWQKVSDSISKKINESILPALFGMGVSMDSLNSKTVSPKIDLDTSGFYAKLSQAQKDYYDAKGWRFSSGGIIGFKEGGILNNILSASQGINLPKFDNGGVLAVLHPPEIVLNSKEAMQLIWNMANQPIKSGGSKNGVVMNNTFNSPKPLTELEINRQFNIFIRELGYRIGLG